MSTTLAPQLTQQFFANNGSFLAGGLVHTYSAGTSTPAVTYTDSTGLTANANPIVLNARGEAPIWLTPNVAYKFVVTDATGNTIDTRDQVTNQQLLTLYGGVDTGTANAYVLTYSSPYQGLVQGQIIYFTAANTNTGVSTLSVNSSGTVQILNQNGTGLNAAEIVANQVSGVLYSGGNWILFSSGAQVPYQASFSGTLVGVTGGLMQTIPYSVSGNNVSLTIPYSASNSNSTAFYITGLPTAITPASNKVIPLAVMQNNGAVVTNVAAQLGGVNANEIVFLLGGAAAGWTASGVKGAGYLSGAFQIGVTVSYSLL